MGKIKENAHIGCIVFFIAICICACFYLHGEIKHKQTKVHDGTSVDMERADSILNAIRLEQLADDPDVQQLADGVLQLKEKLDNINSLVDEAMTTLEDIDDGSPGIDDVRQTLECIKEECALPVN